MDFRYSDSVTVSLCLCPSLIFVRVNMTDDLHLTIALWGPRFLLRILVCR